MKNVTLTIDGKQITVPEDYSIIQAAKELGIEIPALCYDPNLEVVSACRLCVVEIEGSKKLETSCSVKVREGMVVNSETEKVIKARQDILQLLLDSHPNDCLTCQKAGECLLQKYSYKYGVKFRKHDGAMRPELMDTSSPYILKDNSKCILCGKCVRTCSQIKGEREVLAFAERGYDTKIVLDSDKTFAASKCVSCNRCVTVCPVGALVDKRLIGKTRAWEADIKTINCKVCDYGCEFEVLSKDNEKVAVRAKAPSNGRPLCLKGRLTTELLNVDNPDTPYRKIGGKFNETTWTKALGLSNVIDKIEKLEKKDEE
ncbi:(2Fe-2S)-binding protein [Tissierella pigra]|uniref:4Fe-4S dicluster domain-containing protein n=1 Tax=Tissierella pigra TaxID=2607614 RepID=A0A6N7XQ87_9FIRM|nr:2Fe-2S iron-sulfur cluster-binding protein [Tissierella pigra]MBU5425155.1 (2Fe-2S)-binding protein [Tissierella pigra]MSU02962.1 4Fe-4S dicluster domain-containing protein [Tissierella pigra]